MFPHHIARINLRNGIRSWKTRQNDTMGLNSKSWTVKGCITRAYGQGAQTLFATFPARPDAAITGSAAVALFDMYLNKEDIAWHPNDLDIFIAVPQELELRPLAKAFPIITKWVHDARAKGFHYSLKQGASLYGPEMCIFDFVCDNPEDHPLIRHPKVSFIIRCASSVREICEEFDLPMCGPILLRTQTGYVLDVTSEITYMFQHHRTYCRYRVLNTRTMQRMIKYHERGWAILQPERVQPFNERFRREFPTIEYFRPRSRKPISKWFIRKILGRFPTKDEAELYNIDLSCRRRRR